MKIAIVEDTQLHVDTIIEYIKRYEREENTSFNVFCFSDGLKFLDAYKSGFDIVFMDINMPHIDGMETSKRLREMDKYACLIFITEHSSYAISGYEVDAFDFIVKPVAYVNFKDKFKKAIERVRRNDRGSLCIKNKDMVRMIKVTDILCVESVKHKLVYHLLNDDVETWGTLDEAERKLPADCFAKCAKSFIVNLAWVEAVKGDEIILPNMTVPISRQRKKEFIEKLSEFV